MSRKSFFRLAWALTLLLAFSLGCKMVEQVSDVIALASEVGGLATDIDLEGLTTDIDVEGLITQVGGIATQIDLESLSTEMESFSTEMGSITTEMGSFLTDMPIFEEGTPGVVSTPSGFPTDIPVMQGQVYDMTGAASSLSYSVEADLSAVVDFYRREMVSRGWAEQSNTPGDGEARLVFQKGTRRATIVVSEGFLFDVSIAITIEG